MKKPTSQLEGLTSLKDAIKSLQRNVGLKQTGIIDNDTMELIKKPRCGLPDVVNKPKRQRRYAIKDSSRWPKRVSFLSFCSSRFVFGKILFLIGRLQKPFKTLS